MCVCVDMGRPARGRADCQRPEPQYVGYGPPPSVVIAVLCLLVTLTCCCCGISAICSAFCRPKKAPTRRATLAAALKENMQKKDTKRELMCVALFVLEDVVR